MVFKDRKSIRESIAAGSFYPGEPEALKKQLDTFLNNVIPSVTGEIKALVCPHAGYIYSGQIAACSYRQIAEKNYESVIVIAPSHSEYFNFVSVYQGDAYRTPLGLLHTDRERIKILEADSPQIRQSLSGHRNEHSLEVQLPFIQAVLGEIKIIPLVIGEQSNLNISELGNSIGRLFKDENILIIASTDLSHYHPYDSAMELDKKAEKLIARFDSDSFTDAVVNNQLEMCGGGPVASAMIASKMLGADTAAILNYANSGDVSGDRNAVVGYLSAAFYKK